VGGRPAKRRAAQAQEQPGDLPQGAAITGHHGTIRGCGTSCRGSPGDPHEEVAGSHVISQVVRNADPASGGDVIGPPTWDAPGLTGRAERRPCARCRPPRPTRHGRLPISPVVRNADPASGRLLSPDRRVLPCVRPAAGSRPSPPASRAGPCAILENGRTTDVGANGLDWVGRSEAASRGARSSLINWHGDKRQPSVRSRRLSSDDVSPGPPAARVRRHQPATDTGPGPGRVSGIATGWRPADPVCGSRRPRDTKRRLRS
jgi:hypothetical protein